MKYVITAISMQMITTKKGLLEYIEISEDTFRKLIVGATSYVGHKDMANFLGVQVNRGDIVLEDNDVLYLAQKCNGRNGSHLPPEKANMKYYQIYHVEDKT